MDADGDDQRVPATDESDPRASAPPEPGKRSTLEVISAIPAEAAIWAVRQYKRFLSPLLGERCRFYPTCSVYYIQAVQKYGLIRGSAKGLWRICRCHPFHPGGVDLP
jgi:putative membrane protein insertion efficiency factor